jgi:hypothetical protein
VADQFSLTTGLQTLIVPPIVGVACILAYVLVQRKDEVRKELPLEESRL